MLRNLIISSFSVFALTFGLTEIACRVFLESRLIEKFNELNSVEWQRAAALVPDFNPTRDFKYGFPHVAHPYFGHVPAPEILDREKTPKYISRFENDEVFRRMRTADDFVIGIFGGSVADDLARWEMQTETLEAELKAKLPALRKRHFKIVNFAAVRGSQPRQFFIASLYGHLLDLAINLEGFNELNQIRPTEFPPYFPGSSFDQLFFQRSQRDMIISHEFIGTAIKYHRLKAELSQAPSHSSLVRSVQLAELILFNKKLKDIESSKPDQSTPAYLQMRPSTVSELIELWHNQSQNQALLLARKKVPAFFFQQPAPAIPGSKHLTGVELGFRNSLKAEDQAWTDLTMGQIAAERIFALDSEMHFESLLWIFRDEPRTVYVDFCCHLNPIGNDLVSKSIVKYISRHLVCQGGKACYLRNFHQTEPR